MVDPDNEERLLKVPHRVVADIENRVREDERSNNFTPDDHSDGMTESYQRGLDAAREVVEAIPALYKVRGDYQTYSPWHEGKADMKDLAISAIDGLREKQ